MHSEENIISIIKVVKFLVRLLLDARGSVVVGFFKNTIQDHNIEKRQQNASLPDPSVNPKLPAFHTFKEHAIIGILIELPNYSDYLIRDAYTLESNPDCVAIDVIETTFKVHEQYVKLGSLLNRLLNYFSKRVNVLDARSFRPETILLCAVWY